MQRAFYGVLSATTLTWVCEIQGGGICDVELSQREVEERHSYRATGRSVGSGKKGRV